MPIWHGAHPGAPGAGPRRLEHCHTFDELAAATGLTADELARGRALRPGHGRPVGRDTLLRRGRRSSSPAWPPAFLRYGVEARHLRMYKVAAEREAGVFEQVVMPLVKQRNPAGPAPGAAPASTSWRQLGRRAARRHAAPALRAYIDGL